jgi:hypothetical protein
MEEEVKDIRQVAQQQPEDGSGWRRKHRRRPLAVRRLTKAGGLLVIAGLLIALAAACGGGGEEGSPTPPPTGTPSPTGQDSALAPCQALQNLKTYRYTVNLDLESTEPTETPPAAPPTATGTAIPESPAPRQFTYLIDASFVAPDRTEAVITAGSQAPLTMIAIGDQVWVQLAGNWRPTPEQPGVPYMPSDICQAILPDLDLSQVEPQEEQVNDVKSLSYTFSQVSSPESMAKIFGAGSDMDILIKTLDVKLSLAEKDGWPVHLDISGSGLYADGGELRVHLSIDVRDANSGDIQVEPPA